VSERVWLLMGHEFLAQEALARVREETAADPLSEIAFDPGAAAPEIITALETPSLLGGNRLVVVTGVEQLRKEQNEALASYIRSPSPYSVLVLVCSGRTRLAEVVKESGRVMTLEAPKGRRLVGWIRERVRAHRLRVDDRAGWALLDSVGTGLRELDGALNQLATGLGEGSTVGAAEVRQAFPRLADERIYAFTDAVGDRRLSTAMESLRRLIEQGDEPLVVFGALSAQIRRMLVARGAAEHGTRGVRDALGLPEWRAERLLRQVRSYREEELARALDELARADVDMKSGDMPPEVPLERAVVAIVTRD
jgi:DNA polymerase III subunit delta